MKAGGIPVGVELMGADRPETQVNLALQKLWTELNTFISTYEKSHMAMDDGEKKE